VHLAFRGGPAVPNHAIWPRMGESGNVYFAPVSSDPLSLYMASTMVATLAARVFCFAQRARTESAA
jgi:hypothetical protein